jgi:hypothetical protein
VPLNHVVRPMEVRRAIAKSHVAANESSRMPSKTCKFEPEIYIYIVISFKNRRVKRARTKAALLCMPFRQLITDFDESCTVGRPSFHRTQLHTFRGQQRNISIFSF